MKRAGKGGAGDFLRGQVNFGPKGAGKNKTYEATTMSLRGPLSTLTTECPKGASLMGRVDGLDGRSSKVSFKILHTLWVYRLSIYLLIYEIKRVTNILMGFKI